MPAKYSPADMLKQTRNKFDIGMNIKTYGERVTIIITVEANTEDMEVFLEAIKKNIHGV